MQEKRSKKPLLIVIVLAIVGVLAAALLSNPQATSTKVEEELKPETFLSN